MIDRDQLAEATRYNDALSEEHTEGAGEGVAAVLKDLGIDIEGAHRVGFNRALHGLAAVRGGDPEVWGGIAAAGGLTAEQEELVVLLTATFLDGLAGGVRVVQTASRSPE